MGYFPVLSVAPVPVLLIGVGCHVNVGFRRHERKVEEVSSFKRRSFRTSGSGVLNDYGTTRR